MNSRLTRIMVVPIVLLIVSGIVLFREELFIHLCQIRASDVMLLVGYGLILLIFAVFISELYSYWYDVVKARYRWLWFLGYVLLAVLVVGTINTLFLQILVIDEIPNLLKYPRYWKKEFPFFLFPLLFYTLLLHWIPDSRILVTARYRQIAKRRMYWDLWLRRGEPGFLLSYLQIKHGKPTTAHHNRVVRRMDIMAIVYEEKNYFALLWNGEKLLTDLKSKDVQEWTCAGWFVYVHRICFVNMLYAAVDPMPRKAIVLNDVARSNLGKADIHKIENCCTIQRKCQKYVFDFIQEYKGLPIEGLEETVALWPEFDTR